MQLLYTFLDQVDTGTGNEPAGFVMRHWVQVRSPNINSGANSRSRANYNLSSATFGFIFFCSDQVRRAGLLRFGRFFKSLGLDMMFPFVWRFRPPVLGSRADDDRDDDARLSVSNLLKETF